MTDKEYRYHNMWMQMAIVASSMSHCNRRKVGCVIVKTGKIISTGWNGTPAGMENCCEDAETDATLPFVIHAEANALDKLAKDGGVGCEGGDLYVTLQPCIICALRIANSGISRVFYKDPYRNSDGIEFLKSHTNVQVFQISSGETND